MESRREEKIVKKRVYRAEWRRLKERKNEQNRKQKNCIQRQNSKFLLF